MDKCRAQDAERVKSTNAVLSMLFRFGADPDARDDVRRLSYVLRSCCFTNRLCGLYDGFVLCGFVLCGFVLRGLYDGLV